MHRSVRAGPIRCTDVQCFVVKRRLFNLLTALSLLLCVATVVAWLRSEFVYDRVGLIGRHWGIYWWSAYGKTSLSLETWVDSSSRSLKWEHGSLAHSRDAT